MTNDPRPALKPCPFCGSIKVEYHEPSEGCEVYCVSCFGMDRDVIVRAGTKAITIAVWNRRESDG